jgi:hypothetical protein
MEGVIMSIREIGSRAGNEISNGVSRLRDDSGSSETSTRNSGGNDGATINTNDRFEESEVDTGNGIVSRQDVQKFLRRGDSKEERLEKNDKLMEKHVIGEDKEDWDRQTGSTDGRDWIHYSQEMDNGRTKHWEISEDSPNAVYYESRENGKFDPTSTGAVDLDQVKISAETTQGVARLENEATTNKSETSDRMGEKWEKELE